MVARRRRCTPYDQLMQEVSVTMQGDSSKAKKRWRLQSGGRLSSRGLSEGSYGQLLVWENSCAGCGNVPPSRKLGPEQSWQTQKVS